MCFIYLYKNALFMVKKFLFAILLLFSLNFYGLGIEDFGIPFITNYNKQGYNAGTQNWCITQDTNNLMWIGNTGVVLWYDGSEWGRVPVSNNSIVRSVMTTSRGEILVGAFQEFGSIERSLKGGYSFLSWREKLPVKYRNFTDIWRIFEVDGFVLFQCNEAIFIFKDGLFQRVIFPENTFQFSYLVNRKFYVHDKGFGLKELNQNDLVLVEEGDFFKKYDLWNLEILNGHLLAFTPKDGAFIFRNNKWESWDSEANSFIKKYSYYSSTKTDHNELIIGTVQNGIAICDENGNIKNILNVRNGLNNNTVLSMFIDSENNLWLGLDQGISYLQISSPFTQIKNENGFGTGYSSVLFDDKLWLGSNQGLYVTSLNENSNKKFSLVDGSEGQVWKIQILNNTLFCSHHNGLYYFQKNKLKKIDNIEGCWKLEKLPGKENEFIAGTYNGFRLLKFVNNEFVSFPVNGFNESCRIFEFDQNGNIWMSHGYKGVYMISFSSDYSQIKNVVFFGRSLGLPEEINNEVFKFGNKVLIATSKGFYSYNYLIGKLEPYNELNEILKLNHPVTKVIKDQWNRYYFFSRYKLATAIFIRDSLSYFDNNIFYPVENEFFTAFENITFISPDIAILGTSSGFILFNRSFVSPLKLKIPILIKETIARNNNTFSVTRDTLKFNGFKPDVPIQLNNIQVKYSIPLYQSKHNIRCSGYLNGVLLETQMGNRGVFELKKLREGKYIFTLEAVDVEHDFEKSVSEIEFRILPPWYREWYAYVSYLIFIVLLIRLLYIINKRRVAIIRKKEQILQKNRMLENERILEQKALKAEQEMIRIKNENLLRENRRKAEEIANSTMELVEKNKMLLKVKETLKNVQKEKDIETRNSIIRRMLKTIDKDLNNLEKWKIFEDNFEEVHENFLNRFKEKHPEISAKDMKLVAFLRMNLSSKEIAPLLKISIRSVEISRYRLRNKLKLQHNIKLSDYILHF